MSRKHEPKPKSPRSFALQVILFATALIAIGVLLLGLLVNPHFYLLLFAVAALALVPLQAPSPPRPLIGLLLAPALLLTALALVLGFVFHPGFFLLLLLLVILIGLARLLADSPAQLDERDKDAAG